MKTIYHSIIDLMFVGSEGGGGTASEISYDNVESGLISTNVQDAIDEVVSGVSIETISKILGEDISENKLVYLHSDNKVYKASYENLEKATVLGMLIESGVAGDTKKIIQEGTVVDSTWNWDISKQKLYLGLDGNLSETFPTGVGEVIAEVAQIISTTSVYITQKSVVVN